MKNVFQVIQDSLVGFFKGLYPDYDVVCEEIARTAGDPPLEDYIFIDVIPTGNETAGPYHTDRRVLIDAAIHNSTGSNTQYRAIAARIDEHLRPVLHIGDRAVTIPDVEVKIVDHVLHCTFTLAFRDSRDVVDDYPLMGELDITTRIERA